MARPDPHESLEILRRRQVVADRYLRGESQWTIAHAVECDQSTVSRDLEAIRGEWVAASITDLGERKAQELAKLDAVEREHWLAWERSRQPRKVSGEKHKRGGEESSDETFLREEMRDGNPKFLDGVERCILARCKILGLLKSDPDQGAVPDQPALSAESRMEFFSELGRILADDPIKKAAVSDLLRKRIETVRGPFRQ